MAHNLLRVDAKRGWRPLGPALASGDAGQDARAASDSGQKSVRTDDWSNGGLTDKVGRPAHALCGVANGIERRFQGLLKQVPHDVLKASKGKEKEDDQSG